MKLEDIIKTAQETGDFNNKPEMTKFSYGLTLENIIYKWWDDMEKEPNLTKISCVDELICRIDEWVPETKKFHSIKSKLKNR
jgi:hypothetical protein